MSSPVDPVGLRGKEDVFLSGATAGSGVRQDNELQGWFCISPPGVCFSTSQNHHNQCQVIMTRHRAVR